MKYEKICSRRSLFLLAGKRGVVAYILITRYWAKRFHKLWLLIFTMWCVCSLAMASLRLLLSVMFHHHFWLDLRRHELTWAYLPIVTPVVLLQHQLFLIFLRVNNPRWIIFWRFFPLRYLPLCVIVERPAFSTHELPKKLFWLILEHIDVWH